MKYQYVELFKSIEGEAKYSGRTTIYVRFTNCNFTCSKFNNPDNIDPASLEALKFDPKKIQTVNDIPEISVGCDSIYAWNPKFKHIWKTCDEAELSSALTDLLPLNRNRDWSKDILSLTGGEPTLRQKTIPTLLNHPNFDTLKTVLVETNCAVPITDAFINDLNEWVEKKEGRKIIWSNSPKLSASGEDFDKAIIPKNALQQIKVKGSEQYFKFVCGDDLKQFDEVEYAMDKYFEGGIDKNTEVYIMPMACTEIQQKIIQQFVADTCIERGFIYCHRIHNTVYDNAIGK